MSIRNGTHHVDHAGRGWPWGFISPAGKVISGLRAGASIKDHDALAAKLGFKTGGVHEALWHGYTRYLYYRHYGADKQAVEYTLGVQVHDDSPKSLRPLYQYLQRPEMATAWVDLGVDERSAGLKETEGTLSTIKAAVAKQLRARNGEHHADHTAASGKLLLEVQKMEKRTRRNGRHHTDSGYTPDDDDDDFSGMPWGFISPAGEDESGLDVEDGDQVDNHDTLAYSLMFEQGEEDALDHGYIRYLFSKGRTSRGDSRVWLGLTAHMPYARAAKAILRWWPTAQLEPEMVALDLYAHADDLQGVGISLPTTPAKTALKRIAAGEDPAVVKASMPSKNPTYAHDTKARVWGWISPDGKVYDGNKTKATVRVTTRATHDDLARALFEKSAAQLFDSGWVRFAVLRDGSSLFTVSGLTEAAGMKAIKNTIHYLKTAPEIDGEVQLDLFPDWTDTMEPFTATFPHEEAAVTHLSLVKPSGPTAGRVWKSLSEGRQRALAELRYQYQNPASNPTYLGHNYPFKLHQLSPDVWEADFHDHTKYLIGTVTRHNALVWVWRRQDTGEQGEARDSLKSVLADLERRSDQHIGRTGGTMKFIIYNPQGRVIGTVSAPNRAAARDRLRGSLRVLGAKSPQDLFLYPWLNATPEIQAAASQGTQVS